MIINNLRNFYTEQGLSDADFHIGPEHPGLEDKALLLLEETENPSVLEIGYQSGGFSIPVIMTIKDKSEDWKYEGIDNLDFKTSIKSTWSTDLLREFLTEEGVTQGKYTFHKGDASIFLKTCRTKYDLILIDHLKALYPRELKLILEKRLVKEKGVILLHDVSKRAKDAWKKCAKICDAYGCIYEIDDNVVSGLAVVRPGPEEYTGPKGFLKRIVNRLKS